MATAKKAKAKNTARAKPAPTKARASSAPRHRVFGMLFAKIYPLWVHKVVRKGRTQKEVDQVICWLTGYTAAGLRKHIKGDGDLGTFIDQSPAFNPKAKLITGVVCGVRVEEVAEPSMRKVRQLDKLIDELAHGKAMEKVLR
jgi:hypothetical protein